MSQFSTIHNPGITGATSLTAPRKVESGDALKLLTGRQFLVCGDDILHALSYVDPSAGGAFISGIHATKRMNRLRADHVTVPMIVEPAAIRTYWATEDAPFLATGDEDLFSDPSLNGMLDARRLEGSDLAMTPTGQIRAGESAVLKEALRQANALDRSDTLFTLPLAAGWLSDEQLRRQVVKVIDRSRHPVALTFTDRANPLASVKRMRAYRRIMNETTGTVIAYRVDLFGFDARAHGAIASAIGAYPSTRRLNPVGSSGSAIDPEDMSPHMLIGDMLRFVRSTHMRRRWFVEAPSIQCFCAICRGADVDRLHGDE